MVCGRKTTGRRHGGRHSDTFIRRRQRRSEERSLASHLVILVCFWRPLSLSSGRSTQLFLSKNQQLAPNEFVSSLLAPLLARAGTFFGSCAALRHPTPPPPPPRPQQQFITVHELGILSSPLSPPLLPLSSLLSFLLDYIMQMRSRSLSPLLFSSFPLSPLLPSLFPSSA